MQREASTAAEYAALTGCSLADARLYMAGEKKGVHPRRVRDRGAESPVDPVIAQAASEMFARLIRGLTSRRGKASLTNGDVDFIRRQLRALTFVNAGIDHAKMLKRIVLIVCAAYGIKEIGHIFGPRRTKDLVVPRHLAIALVRERCSSLTLPQIGRYFGGRDHTTIMNACERHQFRKERDPDYAEIVRRIEAEIDAEGKG